jgi:hypothetical protein
MIDTTARIDNEDKEKEQSKTKTKTEAIHPCQPPNTVNALNQLPLSHTDGILTGMSSSLSTIGYPIDQSLTTEGAIKQSWLNGPLFLYDLWLQQLDFNPKRTTTPNTVLKSHGASALHCAARLSVVE